MQQAQSLKESVNRCVNACLLLKAMDKTDNKVTGIQSWGIMADNFTSNYVFTPHQWQMKGCTTGGFMVAAHDAF